MSYNQVMDEPGTYEDSREQARSILRHDELSALEGSVETYGRLHEHYECLGRETDSPEQAHEWTESALLYLAWRDEAAALATERRIAEALANPERAAAAKSFAAVAGESAAGTLPA